MTTNTSTTQINWNEFRHKCAELEQECSNLEENISTQGDIFEDFERHCNRPGHTDRDLKKECRLNANSCEELGLQLSELCEKIKKLSDNCITLGHKISNQQFNEYEDKAKKIKGFITEIESKIQEIKLKLT